MKNKISIIIPCYNSASTIKKTIENVRKSIQFCKSLDYELIIVNDGSCDGLIELLKNERNLLLINHDKNKGLSAARNTGICKSTGDLIIFLDSDIYVKEDWIFKMLNIIQNKNIIGVTGTLGPAPNKKLTLLEKYLFSKYRGHQAKDSNTPLDYKSFVFSNTIIKKATLDQVGYFDESLKYYGGEDTELAIRLNNSFPNQMRKCNASSIHDAGKTLKEYLMNVFEYGKYNFIKIVRIHPDYKNDLGYSFVLSWKGKVIFNKLTSKIVRGLILIFQHPLLVKFLVINSFIVGARRGFQNDNNN